MNLKPYYERPRREMLPFVPAAARTVLEVGCGGGAFGGGLKAARAEAPPVVWGVERDADAARAAEGVLDQVFVGDVLEVMPRLGETRFDCIVMNDLLEHVEDADGLLAALAPRLARDGRLVASIPNVRHWTNVVDLALRGRWEYTDEGILDRTHLRFYTRSSMAGLLARNGFAVDSITGINRTGARGFRFFDLVTLGRFTDMGYLQFACVARRADEVPA